MTLLQCIHSLLITLFLRSRAIDHIKSEQYYNETILLRNYEKTGLPRSGKKVWKMKFFPGQGKVKEFCYESGKFRKNAKSQEKSGNFKFPLKWYGYGSLLKSKD